MVSDLEDQTEKDETEAHDPGETCPRGCLVLLDGRQGRLPVGAAVVQAGHAAFDLLVVLALTAQSEEDAETDQYETE